MAQDCLFFYFTLTFKHQILITSKLYTRCNEVHATFRECKSIGYFDPSSPNSSKFIHKSKFLQSLKKQTCVMQEIV